MPLRLALNRSIVLEAVHSTSHEHEMGNAAETEHSWLLVFVGGDVCGGHLVLPSLVCDRRRDLQKARLGGGIETTYAAIYAFFAVFSLAAMASMLKMARPGSESPERRPHVGAER
jgi:hypothetical protein